MENSKLKKMKQKQLIKEVVKEMILNGEIKVSTILERTEDNSGRKSPLEEYIVLAIDSKDGSHKLTKQKIDDGLKIEDHYV